MRTLRLFACVVLMIGFTAGCSYEQGYAIGGMMTGQGGDLSGKVKLPKINIGMTEAEALSLMERDSYPRFLIEDVRLDLQEKQIKTMYRQKINPRLSNYLILTTNADKIVENVFITTR